jgi:hypothetical protein
MYIGSVRSLLHYPSLVSLPELRHAKSKKHKVDKKKLTTSNITALFFLQDRTQNHTQTKKNFRKNGIKEQKNRRKTSINRATRQSRCCGAAQEQVRKLKQELAEHDVLHAEGETQKGRKKEVSRAFHGKP